MSISPLSIPDTSAVDVEEAKQILRAAVREHRKQRNKRMIADVESHWVETAMGFVGSRELVACYVSVNQEPPTQALLGALHEAGKRILLPKLGPGLSRAWGFFEPGTSLVQMAPGRPPEPEGQAFDNDILDEVEAMIIPALAVSHQGARLGQGGGWYDRALKRVSANALVGAMIYPEEFISEAIPQDDMDVSIPYVIQPAEVVATFATR
ncbi:5-formyltetrahydrofolate cyclo-ligase [Trueperella pecoris]|uniref:5-formyltetrahydrofolate cyclo-ligase n=1 Tax=Trueperella pecoris TaxID=2733571 RepID=UPI00186B5F64|nr:5-formyltetrahydrofolate cyclo-ligase [Trueperella pecoris]QOQ38102.1 5-formyltetrahydrofolate cyclo-ligase [Trueperella pecoris]